MKREVNKCGEHAEPLRLGVSLISSWWEAVWGRDGAYYCYGTLRTPFEAVLGCLLCGQQYSRYKHSKQHLKGNHYQILKGDHSFHVIKLKDWDICNFSHATYFFSLDSFPSHSSSASTSPPLQLESSILSVLHVLSYTFHSLFPSFIISLSLSHSSAVRCFLSGSLCEELGRRATWRALSCESVRVERNERTDSPHYRERGRQGAVAKS